MCVYFVLCCLLVGLDWAEPMMNLFLHATCSCILMRTYLQFYILLYQMFGTFLILSLSFFLSLPFMLVASWHLSVSTLCPGTLFFPRHLLLLFLLLLTPHPFTSDSVIRRPNRTSLRTFHDTTFIRNAKSFCQIFLTLTYPLSSTIGVGSHYVAPQSHALP